MARMSPEQIYAVALSAGFDPERAVTFTAIALAESGGDPAANAFGSEDSRGLWQINVSPGVRPNSWGNLYDPAVNARAAFEVSDGGRNIQPWSVTHEQHAGTPRDYRTYLDDARAAAAAVGDGSATAHRGDAAEVFVQMALAQVGDEYDFGVDVRLDDPDPRAFDCAELTEWAAHQVGVELGNASYLQYLELQAQGGVVDVDQALATRGALLFTFSQDPVPGGGRPGTAHVAISLGNGQVVEAASEERGVEVTQAGERFTHAAVVPGLSTAAPLSGAVTAEAMSAFAIVPETLPPPADADGDGLTDEFEILLGTDLADADSDDDDSTDLDEAFRWHTDPRSADTDADQVPDSVEIAEGTDAGYVRPSDELLARGFGGGATADSDSDDVPDLTEFRIGSNRDARDSDLDSVPDNVEYALGSDLTSIDTNRDGITDRVEFDLETLGPRLPLPAEDVDPVPDGLSAGAGGSQGTPEAL